MNLSVGHSNRRSFSTLRHQDDHSYYNIVILADRDKLNPQAKSATFIDSRGEALIDLPNDYHLTVIRFTAPTRNIPIFIYPNTGNEGKRVVDDAYYSVTLKYNNVSYQVFLTYVPENVNTSSNLEEYYYVYSYQNFIDMVNTALVAAFALVPGAAPPTEAPYLTLNKETGLISLFSQQTYAGGNDAGTISIFLNSPLAEVYSSFFFRYRDYNQANGEYAEFVVEDTKNNTPIAPVGYYVMEQEYNNLPDWSILESIIVTSGSAPIKQENVPGNFTGATTDDSVPILADFIPDKTINADRQVIEYRPLAEFRRIDLQGTLPLTFFDVRFEWLDIFGKRRPLILEPFGEPATIKILFTKKHKVVFTKKF